MPADFAFDLFELDWDMFQSHQNRATELVPDFETAGIKTSVCGPNSFTPDLMPLVGEWFVRCVLVNDYEILSRAVTTKKEKV